MTDEKVKATVKREREVRTFAELSRANWVLLKNIEEKRDGYSYECMTTILMAAFKFEAYLNHVGNVLIPYWIELDRLPHKSKLNIIRSFLKMEKSDGERPYQTLHDLFWFRNAIAHGKSECLDPPESDEVGHLEELRRKKPLTRWEELCTIEFAKRSYEDTEIIMKQIHSTAGLDASDLSPSGHLYEIKDVRKLE